MWPKTIFLIALAVSLVACTAVSSAGSTSEVPPVSAPDASCPQTGQAMDTAKIYIEHNATDEDTGVHGVFGGEGWSQLCIWSPAGELLLEVGPQAGLAQLGLSDLFFESREPPNDEYAIDDLETDFPEGEYLVGGSDIDGAGLVATPILTHAIPTAPVVTSPELSEDEEEAGAITVDRTDLVVSWEPVTETITGEPVKIVSYQVTVTKVDHDDANAVSLPEYDVHVVPSVTSLSVSPDFLEPATLYELEVLAIEESGNQTIALGFFTSGN